MTTLKIMVAVDEDGGFGKDGKIPWHFPEDFKHFQKTTKGSICIMGRKTYEDLLGYAQKRQKVAEGYDKRVENTGPPNGEDDKRGDLVLLKDRECVVLSRDKNLKPQGATHFVGLREATDYYRVIKKDRRDIFVIGGEKLFIQALASCDTIHMTIVKGRYDCDRHFPIQNLHKTFRIVDGRETDELYFTEWRRRVPV